MDSGKRFLTSYAVLCSLKKLFFINSIAEQYDELESLRTGSITTDSKQVKQLQGSESEKSAKTLFKYASDHVTMESIYDVSFDIQNAQVIEHHPSSTVS